MYGTEKLRVHFKLLSQDRECFTTLHWKWIIKQIFELKIPRTVAIHIHSNSIRYSMEIRNTTIEMFTPTLVTEYCKILCANTNLWEEGEMRIMNA